MEDRDTRTIKNCLGKSKDKTTTKGFWTIDKTWSIFFLLMPSLSDESADEVEDYKVPEYSSTDKE